MYYKTKKEKKLGKLISNMLEIELFKDIVEAIDQRENEQILETKTKFANLSQLNIPITEKFYLLSRKEHIFFVLSNGTLFLSEV